MNKRVFAVRNIGKALSISGTHIGRKERYLTKNGKILAFEMRYDAFNLAKQMRFECEVVELEFSDKHFFKEVLK